LEFKAKRLLRSGGLLRTMLRMDTKSCDIIFMCQDWNGGRKDLRVFPLSLPENSILLIRTTSTLNTTKDFLKKGSSGPRLSPEA
jgi:hypothetical protein